MNDVLAQIERTLVTAVHTDIAASKRLSVRRRGLALVAVGIALSCGTAVAALGVPGPIENLLSDGPTQFRAPSDGASQSNLSVVDAAGAKWNARTYISRTGLVATAVAQEGDRTPMAMVGGSSGFALADNMARSQGLASITYANAKNVPSSFVGGTVDAQVQSVTVEIDGASVDASLGSDIISVPTAPGEDQGLTEDGRKKAADLPDQLRLKAFAVAIADPSGTDKWAGRPKIIMTFSDGHTATESSGPTCLGPGCE